MAQTPLTPYFSKIYGKNGARSTSILWRGLALRVGKGWAPSPGVPDEKIVKTPFLVDGLYLADHIGLLDQDFLVSFAVRSLLLLNLRAIRRHWQATC